MGGFVCKEGSRLNGKDVRGQNSDFRIQRKPTGSHYWLPEVVLDSEI
jgi:hypothetical protein